MEYYIGQKIELIHDNETIKLKIEEDNSFDCKKCFFSRNKGNSCIRHLYSNMVDAFCSSVTRSDKNNVIYKQIK